MADALAAVEKAVASALAQPDLEGRYRRGHEAFGMIREANKIRKSAPFEAALDDRDPEAAAYNERFQKVAKTLLVDVFDQPLEAPDAIQ